MEQQTTPPPEALERRPEARAYKIEDLLFEVRQGRVRIPPFQRPLRWKPKDALHLIDSIYRGYPVGTLLFWETDAEAGEVQLGTLKIHAGSRSDALWVVDGQQRIVSLSRILLTETPEGDEFALYFDLDEGAFSPPPDPAQRKKDPARWLPMTEVLDSERLMNWLLDHAAANGRERRERAIQLGKRIREYDIPAYLVRTGNEQILREVFGRINYSGKKLEAAEVFDALHGGRGQTKPATVKEIAADLEDLKFGHIEEEKVLYRLLRVLQGVDITKGLADAPLRLTAEEAAHAYRDTAQAARDAIHFIVKDAGIPRYELLPYKQPLVTLGKFFHHHTAPGARSLQLLARWLWRGALSGTHRGDTASARFTLERIDPMDEEKSVQRLLDQIEHQTPPLPEVTDAFNFRWANSKLQTLALLGLGPRNLETGELLDPEQLGNTGKGSSNLQVPQLLSPRNDNPLFRSVANRVIHPSRHALRTLVLRVTDHAVLRSHAITDEALEALRDGNFEGFLELRADFLRTHFEHFFAERARWEESDRPSLASLIVADEED